jgi:hypothetical protein
MKHSTYRQRSVQSGSALIISLFFIVLITVIVVGFLDAARADRSAATTHLDRLRAATMAREGIERSVATLRRETTDPPQNPGETDDAYNLRKRNWISEPGALFVPNPAPADQKQLRRQIDLSSGAPTSGIKYADPVFEAPNLNIQLLVDQNPPGHLITDRVDSVTTAVSEMKLKWIYVRSNAATGAYDYDLAENPSLTDKVKPIIGRFAYWTDDESTKINYNLAWKRTNNANNYAHPSRINLMGLTLAGGAQLTEPMADALHSYTTLTPGRYFNSFADARAVESQPGGAGISDMLAYNKFELTHFNHDPDTTFFGENRILLTTNGDLVPKIKNADGTDAKNPDGTPKYAREFLDIMRDDKPAAALDPGNLDDIAGGQPDWAADVNGNVLVQGGKNKLDTVVRNLIDYISKTSWPLSPGVSFKDKYYPGTPDSSARLAQIAVNIIDYVRAKESRVQVIAPFRFALNPNDGKYTLHPSYAYGGANSYQGICRSPYITEIGMWMEKDPSAPNPIPSGWPGGATVKLYKCYFRYELYLPPNYGFDANGIELVPDTAAKPATGSKGWFTTWTEVRDTATASAIYYYISPTTGTCIKMSGHATNGQRIFKEDIEGGGGPNGTSLLPGKYVTITKAFWRDKDYASRSTINTRAAIYGGVSGSDGLLAAPLNRWARTNIATQSIGISYKVGDPSSTTLANMPSVEVDDPRCNVHPNDWTYQTTHSFGKPNKALTVGKAPTMSPAGRPQQDTDENGKISDFSLYMPEPKGIGKNGPTGDNGRVSSIGELGYVHTGNEANNGSTPWRTIRLQPNNYPDSNTLPDWAFMDLFAVPTVGATGPAAIFTPHGTSVAGRINVNSHAAAFNNLVRDRGLVGLLAGTKALPSVNAAESVANNIYNRTLATGLNKGKTYGYPWTPNPAPSDPNAFDTPGEICEIKGVADGGEKSEDLIREIASLVTARGGVFNIYTLGQSLKQTPTGKLLVTAEQRQQALVERYLDTRNTQDKTDDVVRLRTVYFRNLTP